MGKTIAIDLGTTNSVVAVLGCYPDAGRVLRDELTVISDDKGNLTFPSVVAYESRRDPPFIVGHIAKQRIKLQRSAEDPLPIATIKRYLGSEEQFQLGPQRYRPEEISGMILYFLVELAELRLGDAVDDGLITVPAYFGHHETRLTGEALEVHCNHYRQERGKSPVKLRGILKEPIAAAYAYGVQDERPTLRVLVYDLGGGTFDVSVLEKRDGVVNIVDFAGDRQLGGHNFDGVIANQLLTELSTHYNLKLDLERRNPRRGQDQARYAKLLEIAERAKIEVGAKEGAEYEIHESDIFTDKSAEQLPVNIVCRSFSRDELDGLINGYLNETMDLTWGLMDKAQLVPENLDEVLLVGGSSKLTRIATKLRLAPLSQLKPPVGWDKDDPKAEHYRGGFGKEPKIFLPDLAVAIGAAYFTHETLEATQGPLRLSAIPSTTTFPKVAIAGSTEAEAARVLRVTRHDGKSFECNVESGEFSVTVDLRPSSRNRLDMTLLDENSAVLARHTKEIVHREDVVLEEDDPPGAVPVAFLSHDLWIDLAEGDSVVAKRGEILPKEFNEELRAVHRAQAVVLHLSERNTVLADLSIPMSDDFEVPAGHPLTLRGRITEDEKLVCELSTMLNGKLKRQEVSINYHPRVVREPTTLSTALEELRSEYRSTMSQLDRNDAAEQAVGILQRLKDCDNELDRAAPDALRIEQKLLDVQALLEEVNQLARWKQEHKDFEAKLSEARHLAASDPDAQREVLALGSTGEAAYQRKDRRSWQRIEEAVRRLILGLSERRYHTVSTGAPVTRRQDVVSTHTQLTRNR